MNRLFILRRCRFERGFHISVAPSSRSPDPAVTVGCGAGSAKGFAAWPALFLLASCLFAAEPGNGSSNSPAAPAGPSANVKVLVLSGAYEDSPAAQELDPFALLTGSFEKPGSFFELCSSVNEAAANSAVDHVFFDLSSPSLRLNLAQIGELSRHIQTLRGSGKRTVAWIESATTVHYAVASACDTVLMADLGSLDLPSLSLTSLHFHDAMELLGARVSFVRTGDFKGAVEPFTLSHMSPELRTHYTNLLTSMNDWLVDRIAAGRASNSNEVRKAQADRLFTPAGARAAGLVDTVVPFGSERQAVATLLGREVNWILPEKIQPKPLSVFELMGKLMGGAPAPKSTRPSVAVLHLDGQIMDGEKDLPGILVSGPTVRAIRDLEGDAAVKAVVVRINSPGGSASASEAIRAALAQLAAKKPVVVSMGAMAASGGYWIACLGRPILAEPATLTGSIGVFALKLSLGPFLKKVGLNIEHVSLDESAGAMSIDRTWTPAEEERMRGLVVDIYDRFTRLVAESRHLTLDQVVPMAGGRVWSGAQAHKLGLVDQLGGLDDALVLAAREAGLDPGYDILHRPLKRNFFELLDLFGGLEGSARGLVDQAAITAARAAGFRLDAPLRLLREGLTGGPSRVWLLETSEFVIR